MDYNVGQTLLITKSIEADKYAQVVWLGLCDNDKEIKWALD